MIYLLVLTYNREQQFARFLDSVYPAVMRPDVRMHVLMHSDSEYAMIGNHITYHMAQRRYGCAEGRNFLVEQLDLNANDIVIFLDDDLYATDGDWLDALIAPIRENRAELSGVEPMRVTDTYYTLPAANDIHYLSGGWMAVGASVLLAGLRFDEAFTNYYEDVVFGLQARAMGFRLCKADGVGLHHEPHGGNEAVFMQSRQRFIEQYGHLLTVNS